MFLNYLLKGGQKCLPNFYCAQVNEIERAISKVLGTFQVFISSDL